MIKSEDHPCGAAKEKNERFKVIAHRWRVFPCFKQIITLVQHCIMIPFTMPDTQQAIDRVGSYVEGIQGMGVSYLKSIYCVEMKSL